MIMDILSGLAAIAGEDSVLTGEAMSRHTTFRTGGPARFFVEPATAKQVALIIKFAKENNINFYVVGNGSNLLVSDEGYDGIIIHIGKKMSGIHVDGDTMTVGAGALMSAVGVRALEAGLTGFEFGAGIPGSIGGACMMNAGAYGGEMKDVLVSARVITPEGFTKNIEAADMDLSYRHSAFADNGCIVVEATIRLKYGDHDAIKALMEELSFKRRDKQPLEFPSAGSTFKRPEGYFAGALIEGAGLKGKGVGDACVSEKHAGFVINRGKATTKDVLDTIKLVQETVFASSGVHLEPEVKMI